MRNNPYGAIYKACYSGSAKERIKDLLPFPRMVDIELTNLCNFECRMCPVGNHSMKRKQGFMSGNVYHKIINELMDHETPIRFIRWGEPLLHPELLKFVRAAKACGLLTHLNTNGFFVDDEFIRAVVKIPLDSIKFSFQGTSREAYKKYRGIDFYDGLVDAVRQVYLYRDRKESPYINIGTTVTDESPEEIAAFKKEMLKIADKVHIGETRNLNRPNQMHCHNCPEVFDKLSVNWDGTVSACCSDWDNMMLVGDVKANTLKEIWNSDKSYYYRQMIVAGRHSELELCRRCPR